MDIAAVSSTGPEIDDTTVCGAVNAVVGFLFKGALGLQESGEKRDERGVAREVDAKLDASPSNAAKVADRSEDRMIASVV